MEDNLNVDHMDQPELDPYHKAQDEFEAQSAEFYRDQEAEKVENAELEKQAIDEENKWRPWSYNIPVYGHVMEHVVDPASLGVGDFIFDAVGLVPWLKPADQWWDNNSPRSKHPAHKLIRDASSVIIPSMIGGGAVVGYAKGATQAMRIPGYARALGTVGAYAGVDTSVAMISSHSKTDDNLAGTLENWLGVSIPWATRAGDSPDVRWKKNVMESAGLSAGVELLGAAFTFGRKAKLFPRDAGAEQAIKLRDEQLSLFEDPVSAVTEPRRQARKAAQTDEMIQAIEADPTGTRYNAFVNDVGPDDAGRAVTDLEADPLKAKLDQVQIQQNLDTLNGRMAPVADSLWQRNFMNALDSNSRAKQLDQLFDSISPSFDAVIEASGKPVKITAEQMNRSVDNLTNAVYGRDLSFQEFEFLVEDMKRTVFNSNQVLDEENWIIASQAFKNAYDQLFDPNQMRASAMLAQNAADTVADTATAAIMLGDTVDNSRQWEIIFKKLNLLGTEIKANEFIVARAREYKKLKATGDIPGTIDWMNRQAGEFDEYLKLVKQSNGKLEKELASIAKDNPAYLKPFKEIYDSTNGKIDTLDKMHKFTEQHIGFIKKAFIDGNPEVPSVIVRGLHAARINSVLSGLSAGSAAIGNTVMTAVKPISVLAGSKLTGQNAVYKRALYTYGGITENIRRAWKVMKDEWHLASRHPEEAMMRGRADLRKMHMERMEYMDTMAEAWKADGELGKVAMWNIAKGLTWWNKQFFVKYGTNALYAIDGFTNSFMASGMARARAYDDLFEASNGSFLKKDFIAKQRELYNEAFDSYGVLTDRAAKFASQEIALNLDNKVVQNFENFLNHVPAAKPLFMFPRTGLNGVELGWSFNPVSNLGPALTKARRVLAAKTGQQKMAALAEHGLDAMQNPDLAFATLKSEYIGRQIMGSSVVMGVGMLALDGVVTGAGPQDDAERRRMMAMGWKPYSIKNPITGEWRSYKRFEPFAGIIALTADIVYQANRVDQSITEDWFRKLGHAITMNVTNETFISGFEPLAGLISRDPSAWTRFWALQADTLTPFKGVRSVLNNIVSPQLKDVDNDFGAYMKNANKFLFSGDEDLPNQLDIYTGNPIKHYHPIIRATNAFLPMFKSNGGMEPWRQWLLATGWDGLQKIRTDKNTGLPLEAKDRQFINNWIAKNSNLDMQIQQLMSEDDGYWNKFLKDYTQKRGLRDQKDFPIKKTLLYKRLNDIHRRAFDGAWDALDAYKDDNYSTIGREIKNRDRELGKGRLGEAKATQNRVEQLLKKTRNK